MPTYDYECTKCKHNFEEFQRITSEPVAECPKCSHRAKRLISGGAGIIFKGSGFYTTDYKNASANKKGSDSTGSKSSDSSKAESAKSSSSDSNSSGKSESKSDGKSTEKSSSKKS